jgi:hypothetical protein
MTYLEFLNVVSQELICVYLHCALHALLHLPCLVLRLLLWLKLLNLSLCYLLSVKASLVPSVKLSITA